MEACLVVFLLSSHMLSSKFFFSYIADVLNIEKAFC